MEGVTGRGKYLALAVLLLPSLIGMSAFYILPVVSSFVLSFTKWDLLTPIQWIGIGNYIAALADPAVQQAQPTYGRAEHPRHRAARGRRDQPAPEQPQEGERDRGRPGGQAVQRPGRARGPLRQGRRPTCGQPAFNQASVASSPAG